VVASVPASPLCGARGARANRNRFPPTHRRDGTDGVQRAVHRVHQHARFDDRTQIVGLRWQVNSSQGAGTCTVELRIDDIKFIP